MREPGPSSVKETQYPAAQVLAEGNPPRSGTTNSDSVATVSDLLSFEKILPYKLTLMRNSMSAAVHMFKDPNQWSDLNIAIEVLNSAARMAKLNVSPLRGSLLRFHNSVTALKSAESIVVAPKILEYGRQLTSSKEKASHIASVVSKYDQEQLSLQDQLKASTNNITNIHNPIALLNKEI
ncbi:uncharacterized protein LOC131233526 [Magnolia sinica]|uniref:uncharacterized protein LOC131233526 n=1 Tax=Magnolia sinica TaxID=86752 RepID=UPI00265AF273|nr:uncharacterized protein LOC131233526 [Magnolia sinica]